MGESLDKYPGRYSVVQKVLLNIWEHKIWGSTLDWEYSDFFPKPPVSLTKKIIFRNLNAVLIFTAVYESMKLETSTRHNVFYEEKKVCNKLKVELGTYLMWLQVRTSL